MIFKSNIEHLKHDAVLKSVAKIEKAQSGEFQDKLLILLRSGFCILSVFFLQRTALENYPTLVIIPGYLILRWLMSFSVNPFSINDFTSARCASLRNV